MPLHIFACQFGTEGSLPCQVFHQQGLTKIISEHTDDCELSFGIEFNHGFQESSACFIDNGTMLAPNCGGGTFYCGHCL